MSKQHTEECRWEKLTTQDCGFRDTHHYCPHKEHLCDCEGQKQESNLLGLYADDLADDSGKLKSTTAQGRSGNWYIARPLRFESLTINLKRAWHVFIGKADALYWRIDEDK